MRRSFFFMTVVLMSVQLAFTQASGSASSNIEAQALQIVLGEKTFPTDMFAQSFLTQIPASRLASLRDHLVASFGPFERVDGANGRYVAHYMRGTLNALIHLDQHGKIDYLLLRRSGLPDGSSDGGIQSFAGLPGAASYLILKNGKDLAARDADLPMSVGSAFKLAVLDALQGQIDAKRLAWTEYVKVQPAWRSLPDTVLQRWLGSSVTLQALATEMISISDNTAADSLIHIVGRNAVEALASGNRPFLTTREMFSLRSMRNQKLRERFRSGRPQQRRAILSQLDAQRLPEFADIDTSPALSDIEWHFSARRLCALIEAVQALPVMNINPGVARKSQWERIAYKGGSDWGVINMTTRLEAHNGDAYCVSVTWNDREGQIDQPRFAAMYAAVLEALATQS